MSLKGTNNTTSDGARIPSVPERLDKYVKDGTISSDIYNKAMTEYYEPKDKKDKERSQKKHELYISGYPLKEYMPIMFFFSVIGAIGIIMFAIGPDNHWAQAAAVYLLIAFFLYHYSNVYDNQLKDDKIAQLKQEIKKLKNELEANKEHKEMHKEINKNLESNKETKYEEKT